MGIKAAGDSELGFGDERVNKMNTTLSLIGLLIVEKKMNKVNNT